VLHWAGGAHRCGMLAGGDRTAPPTACRHTLGSPENREDVMAFGERILGSNRALISSIGELCRKDLARGQPGRLAGCAVIARTPCRILMSAAVSARRLHQPLDLRRWHCPTPQPAGGDETRTQEFQDCGCSASCLTLRVAPSPRQSYRISLSPRGYNFSGRTADPLGTSQRSSQLSDAGPAIRRAR